MSDFNSVIFPPLEFPDRACAPVNVAVFDDASLQRRRCSWAWPATIVVVVFILMVAWFR